MYDSLELPLCYERHASSARRLLPNANSVSCSGLRHRREGWRELTPGHVLWDRSDFIKKATASTHERAGRVRARNTTEFKTAFAFCFSSSHGVPRLPLLPPQCNLYGFCHKARSMSPCKICVLGQSHVVGRGPVNQSVRRLKAKTEQMTATGRSTTQVVTLNNNIGSLIDIS